MLWARQDYAKREHFGRRQRGAQDDVRARGLVGFLFVPAVADGEAEGAAILLDGGFGVVGPHGAEPAAVEGIVEAGGELPAAPQRAGREGEIGEGEGRDA